MTVLYHSDPERGAEWAELFAARAPDIAFDHRPEAVDPLRRHAKVLITPHIASMTRLDTAVDIVIDNICRHRAGKPMVELVDRRRGY